MAKESPEAVHRVDRFKPIVMSQEIFHEARTEIDEYCQEEYSDDSINVNCVLSWRSNASTRLRVDIDGQFVFDSGFARTKPELLATLPCPRTPFPVEAALRQLRRMG